MREDELAARTRTGRSAKTIKTRGHFPTEEAARYLSIINAKKARDRPTTGAPHCFHSKSTSATDRPDTQKVGHPRELSRDDARSLLRGLLELHAIPGEEFPWDPSLGDAFNAREAELERRVGRSAAGWLSAGRPRREAFRVGLRLTARARVREFHDALIDQAAALAAHAHATKTALATDYTYLQPAQPTTIGHLLLAYAFPALRDADRARRSHASLGASVAGAGGSAGSRWALDATGSPNCWAARRSSSTQRTRPGRPTSTSTLAIAATHHTQLGQDFEIYASQEFGLIDLADAHSRASALMPPKKNPYALAAVRTQAGQAAGSLAAALAALHTGSARTDHFHLLNGTVPRALR